MLGAILGDIIGSPYEFNSNNVKTTDFPLLSERSCFTDDSVMTIAVAQALMESWGEDDDAIKATLIREMQKYGRAYPHAGYGGRFRQWLYQEDPQPYHSCGNGSAMRVSPAGWLSCSLVDTLHIARLTAEVTHNHPAGIKGAQAVASAIFLSRCKKEKAEISDYLERQYGYDMQTSLDEIRSAYHMDETCQGSVPQAIRAFLESYDYESAVRLAVSIGGDSDTIACIAGSIAEAYYGMPENLKTLALEKLDAPLRKVVERYREFYKLHSGKIENCWRESPPDEPRTDRNTAIENAITNWFLSTDTGSQASVLNAIAVGLQEEVGVFVPCATTEKFDAMLDPKKVKTGDTITLKQGLHFKLEQLDAGNGEYWAPAFTSVLEAEDDDHPSVLQMPLSDLIELVLTWPSCRGIAINPWGLSISIPKGTLRDLVETKPKPTLSTIRANIEDLWTDAIVNAGNHRLQSGNGVSAAIYRTAGPELEEACQKLHGCHTGEAKLTAGYGLHTQYVIHTVGPNFRKNGVNDPGLAACYQNCLELACSKNLYSIAFPCIATGAYGYPYDNAANVAVDACAEWAAEHPNYPINIYFYCHSQRDLSLYQKLLQRNAR